MMAKPMMSEEIKSESTAEGAANGTAAPAVTDGQAQPPANPNMKWYIIHTYSGFEKKVRESLQSRVQAFGLQEKIGRIVIPTETVTQVRAGKKYTSEQMFYPGYVLVELDLTGFNTQGEGDQVWHVVKSTPRVTGFLGAGQFPTPLTDDEVNQIIYRTVSAKDKPRMKMKFEKNEAVRITDGPFANFNGIVDEVNEDRETLKVMVTIFGRATPVELEFGQVEKVA